MKKNLTTNIFLNLFEEGRRKFRKCFPQTEEFVFHEMSTTTLQQAFDNETLVVHARPHLSRRARLTVVKSNCYFC